MSTIIFQGVKINYTVTGNGPVLVWLHGFLENLSIWQKQVEFFNNNYTNICIDLLGHGKTGVVNKIHTPVIQAKMVSTVLETLQIDGYSIIGHSMGGYVALAFAEEFPDKLRNLVLLNSTSYADSEEKKQLRKRAIKIIEDQKETYVRLGVVNLFSENSRKKLKKEIEQLVEIGQKTSAEGIKAALNGMMLRSSRLEVLKSFKGKKVIISGKEDPIILVSESEKEASICKAEFLELQGGHMLYIENVEQLNNELSKIFI